MLPAGSHVGKTTILKQLKLGFKISWWQASRWLQWNFCITGRQVDLFLRHGFSPLLTIFPHTVIHICWGRAPDTQPAFSCVFPRSSVDRREKFSLLVCLIGLTLSFCHSTIQPAKKGEAVDSNMEPKTILIFCSLPFPPRAQRMPLLISDGWI